MTLPVYEWEWIDGCGDIRVTYVGEARKDGDRWLIPIGRWIVPFLEEEPAVRVHKCWQARTVGCAWGKRGGEDVFLRHYLKHGVFPAIPRGTWLPLREEEVRVPLYKALLALHTEREQTLRGVTGIFSNQYYTRKIQLPQEKGFILLLSGLLEILPDRKKGGKP